MEIHTRWLGLNGPICWIVCAPELGALLGMIGTLGVWTHWPLVLCDYPMEKKNENKALLQVFQQLECSVFVCIAWIFFGLLTLQDFFLVLAFLSWMPWLDPRSLVRRGMHLLDLHPDPFEREIQRHREDLDYLSHRDPFAWLWS